ncbi:hypothetical protein [Sphingobium abikonense]|uniref:hypothetical protein n=1 Tax=Sphingobium abikonense TaxID=86193 RepID=UPI0035154549
MELTVQKLPDGSREKMLWLTARFDTAGQIAACEPGNADQNEVKLAEVACAQAKAMPVEVMRDNDGNPISVIRSLNVQFKTAE